MYTTIAVTGSPAAGVSSGQAIAAIEEVAAETLPSGYGYDYSGLTREGGQGRQLADRPHLRSGASSSSICSLSAQYESHMLPWAVILSIPFRTSWEHSSSPRIMGIDNNIYLQIALIMLIGLLAKNAILIVQFARLSAGSQA